MRASPSRARAPRTALLLGVALYSTPLDGAREEQARSAAPVRLPVSSAAQSSSGRAAALAQEPWLDPAAEAALERGLDYVAGLQAPRGDGALVSSGSQRYAPVGLTALGILALLAGGTTPDRGPHGAVVSRALRYLLSQADASPFSPELGYIAASGDSVSKMHGHGYATLALAQAWCVSPATPLGREIEAALRAAIALIERTQNAEGAWFYEARRGVEHEGSVTVTLVQGLRAARDAGLLVDARVIERAELYVKNSQTADGSYAYHLGSTQTSVGLTAAAIATLNMAGTYSGPAIDDGLEFLLRELLARRDDPARRKPIELDHVLYERLYVAQALWQHHDAAHFLRWFPSERDALVHSQRADGSWEDEVYGAAYATAVNCLVLAMPQGYLPIFQR